MRQAGGAGWIVDGARIDKSVEGNDRGLVPLDDGEVQAIGQSELGDLLRELLEVLRGEASGRKHQSYG